MRNSHAYRPEAGGARKWLLAVGDEDRARALARGLDVTPLTASLLIQRGVADADGARRFLASSLEDLASPINMQGMGDAVARLIQALDGNEQIAVWGDYDADGVTAMALLVEFFTALGMSVHPFLPRRIEEGYGLNVESLRALHERGVTLVVTVDCGVSDHREIKAAREMGLDIIITDHHQLPAVLPEANAVVNPQREPENSALRPMTGVGVALGLAIACRAALREDGRFASGGEPPLKKFLDLVALGTLADVAPLTGNNRILVKSGLRQIGLGERVGLAALCRVAGVNTARVDCADISFRLAPRINASGRLSSAHHSLDLMLTKDAACAAALAMGLDEENQRRQRLEGEIEQAARRQLESDARHRESRTICLAGEGWHEGVIGIVASRLMSDLYRPVVLISASGNTARGSARSIQGVDIYRHLEALGDMLEQFGGHPAAAGFSIRTENIEAFRRALEERVLADTDPEAFTPTLNVDAETSLADITPRQMEEMETLAPFGAGNPEPVLVARGVTVTEARVVGRNHLKMLVHQDRHSIDGIGFNLGERLGELSGPVDMVFVPQMNEWQGRLSPQLKVVDFH